MNQAAGFGCGEVSEPDCLDGEHGTIRWRRQRVIVRDRLPNLFYASREIFDLPGVGFPVLIYIAKIEPRIGVAALRSSVR